MLQFRLDTDQHPLTILLIGAHCDDIEIGCGGTVLRLADALPDRAIRVDHSQFLDTQRAAETLAASQRLLTGVPQPVIRIEEVQWQLLSP